MELKDNKIEVFKFDGENSIDVVVQNDTVWASVEQLVVLFDRAGATIRKHINNVFSEHELSRTSNVLSVVLDGVNQNVSYYSLDVIISVGYRVKSQRGVQFRQWATKVLKKYMYEGYVVNEQLDAQKYQELSSVVRVMGRTIHRQEKLSGDEALGLIQVVDDYVYALDTLDNYDYQRLEISNTTSNITFHATYENAMVAINVIKEKYGESSLFGNEKDDSFKSSIGQIYQTFDGCDLYPSIEEKAAMLLYLVVKNHSFSDGNKRIAAMLFLWFMMNNGILYNVDGTKRINDNTLVALTLMIAESRPEEKDIMVKVIVNLINKNNYY